MSQSQTAPPDSRRSASQTEALRAKLIVDHPDRVSIRAFNAMADLSADHEAQLAAAIQQARDERDQKHCCKDIIEQWKKNTFESRAECARLRDACAKAKAFARDVGSSLNPYLSCGERRSMSNLFNEHRAILDVLNAVLHPAAPKEGEE